MFRRPTIVFARIALACAVVACPSAALADGEIWVWTENRIPIVRTETPEFPRLDWRVSTDMRANTRSNGFADAFLRTGPVFFPTSFAFIALHGTIHSIRASSGAYEQEARLEFEPNFFGRLGDFTLSDRNRVEYRWLEGGPRWRYRNQLRVNYAPVGARWLPFVWDEVLIDLSGLGFNQNRFEVGLGRMITDTTRLDVGYMFRSREDDAGNWAHDHVLNLSLFFDVPK